MVKIWQIEVLIIIVKVISTLNTARAHAIGEVHSDLVVTKFAPDNEHYGEDKDNEEEPGWMVQYSTLFSSLFL